MIEKFKLWYRTFRYQYKNDVGGMHYIKSNIMPGDIVFDIGAHKGAYLNLLRSCVGKKGTVIGFEPQYLLYEYLSAIKQSSQWSNVIIEHLALSDREGKSNLYIPVNKVIQDSSPGATLLHTKSKEEVMRIEEVDIMTLDQYIEQSHFIPSFLKIDVEGNELNVFKGGLKLLSQYKPKILVEIEARHIGREKVLETFKFLKELNYSGQFIHKKSLVSLDKFSLDHYQNTNKMSDYCNNFIFD